MFWYLHTKQIFKIRVGVGTLYNCIPTKVFVYRNEYNIPENPIVNYGDVNRH